jgi:hypothetical protein
MELPVIKNHLDIADFDEKSVKIEGVYRQMNVAKRPNTVSYGGRTQIVLEDKTIIAIEKGDKGLRSKTEIQEYEGKRVIITGVFIKRTALWGDNKMASIVAPVIMNITKIELVADEAVVYHYADGSANLYKVSGNTVAYIPVTPEQSSSGNYSGGEPKIVNISPIEKEKLVHLLEKALIATEQHHERREMMTGVVVKSLGENEKQKVILKSKSELKNEIEIYLKYLLK